MKIVLSRKGFDSQSGGMASPIMPDGTLLSLPIPDDNGETTYSDLVYEGKTYYKIIQELNPRIAEKLKNRKCHVDPDICNRYIKSIENWKPAFGQNGTSKIHLETQNVGLGDIFLFYGWFRQTELDNSGKLRFVNAPKDKTTDKHIIFGYMEIGEIITNRERIVSEFNYHPHAYEKYKDSPSNALYIPSQTLSFDGSIGGCGMLKYIPIRQLTKAGHKRSEWNLPDCFKNIGISYHENNSYGWTANKDYFKAAYRGQEFVTKSDISESIKKWVTEVICS